MKLYLYDRTSKHILAEVAGAKSYTDTQVLSENGCIYAPLAANVELSSKADCSETLRADWAAAHPTQEERMGDMEELLAELLYGGEA